MNFTREPIIETVITPREGCRLLIRSSKTADREEHSVEAVEVISFGHSFFFRSLDRAKPFLVPMADYELLEEKEVRIALKSAVPDRSIKIGGGRSSAPREREVEHQESDSLTAPASTESAESQPPMNRRRDKRRSRRRRGGPGDMARPQSPPSGVYPNVHHEMIAQQEFFESAEDEEPVVAPPPVPVMSKLLPPPAMLIKETLGRYKTADEFSPPLTPLHHTLPPESGRPVEEEESSSEETQFDEPL